MDQYDTILKVSGETQSLIANRRNKDTLALGKKVLDKIHTIRYRMAYRKADAALTDDKLEKSWESLHALINKPI